MLQRLRTDEPNLFEQPSIAQALRVILLAILCSSLAVSALTFSLSWRLAPQLSLLASASCIVALALVRYGRIRAALLAPLLTLTYVVLHLAARSDGLQSIGLAVVPVLLIVGSLVLGRLTLIFFTICTLLAVASMAIIRYFVMRAELYSTNDLGDFIIFTITCATAALVGRLFAVRIQEAFRLIQIKERRYRRIFDNVQDVYFEMGADSILVEVSPAGYSLFGIAPDGMVGRSLADFGVSQSELDDLLGAIRAQGHVSNRELVIRNSHKAFVHVLVNASLQADFETGSERIVGSIRDITDRKRAEMDLSDSEDRFRSLCLASLEGIVVHSDGVILDANPQFARLLGYESTDELIGRNGFEFIVNPESAMLLRERMQDGKVGPCEITGVRKDSSTFAAETDSRALQYRGHNAIILSWRDISERKRAEIEREKLWAQLAQAQKMESIGRLAGGVAHDFNNLLTVINGYSQMLLETLGADDPCRAFAGHIFDAGQHAVYLTGQLLAFSRKQVLQLRVLDLNSVVQSMQPMLQRLVGEDIEVRLVLSKEKPAIKADPHQLEQVLMNLAVNSRDAMPKGGLLLIEARTIELNGGVSVSRPEVLPGRYAMLAVSDTGAGMDDVTRQRIFEPFFTTKPVGKGTGLGLSMVQGIVAQSGGYVDVHSEPNRGTTFMIYLPALDEQNSRERVRP